MNLQTLFFHWGVKVLHRLPGRLRLEITALRKIPPEDRDLWREVLGSVVLPSGVTSVDVSFVGGSALLKYDPRMVTETDVMNDFRKLLQVFMEHRDELQRTWQDDETTAISLVNNLISKADLNRDARFRNNGGIR